MKFLSITFVAAILLHIPRVMECQVKPWFKFEFQDEDTTGTVLPALQNQVRAQYGNHFDVYFAVFDSAIGNIPIWNTQEAITDPYGTLRGTVFFWAVPEERNFEDRDSLAIGFFKNGQITWSSPPVYKGGITQIYATRDLNKDGEVDLVMLWSSAHSYNPVDEVFVFSWNGVSCRLISDFDTEYRFSKLSTARAVDLIDADGDGIYDLRAYWSDAEDMKQYFPDDPIPTRPWVTYSWDGTKYSLAPTEKQIPVNAFFPANKLAVAARCRVTIENNRYRYDYVFANDSSSEQRAETIIIGGLSDSSSMYAPSHWITGGYKPVLGRAFIGNALHEGTMIEPGESRGGFGYTSDGLPTIVKYYVQGLRPFAFDEPGWPISDEQYRNDILFNSFSNFTLGATNPPDPFIPVGFLDTLTSYTTQSRSLGWIKDQPTADKYLGYFTSAKTKLQQRDTASTRTALEFVLRDVDVDSSSTLTSEAYALLRYNTEYLLVRLPRPKQLTIDDLISLKHEAYAKGWIGDEHFVKELDNGLENAKKHLARGDSVNCAKELEKFQDKVKKEYDKTVEDRKKNKSRDKRFVTEEGYASLTKAAQSIIDRLPQKKKR